MAPSRIEPTTYQLVAQCLKQLHQHMPPYIKDTLKFKCPASWPKGKNLKMHKLYQTSMNICSYHTATGENYEFRRLLTVFL
jgi:hypothetical protein